MPHGGLALWAVITILWCSIIMGIVLITYRYRHSPAATNRCSLLTLIILPAPLILLPWILYRPLVSTAPSCFFDLWCFFIGNSFIVTFNFCRFVRILHIYRIKEALLGSSQYGLSTPSDPESDRSIQLIPKAWNRLDRPIPHSPNPLVLETPYNIEYLSQEWKEAWWFRYRNLLTERSLVAIGFSIMLCVTLLVTLISVIHGPYPDQHWAIGQCMLDCPFWIAYIYSLIIKSILYPSSFLLLRKASDAYGIRPCFISAVIPNMPQKIRTSLFLTFFLLYLLNGVYSIYVLPLLDIIRARHHSNSATLTIESFHTMLKDPTNFHAFLHFSVWDLSVENPLFYRRYHQLVDRTAQLHRHLRTSTDSDILGEAGDVADKARSQLREDLTNIHATFLSPSSHYELNVPREMAQLVERHLAAGNYRLHILDDVLNEVTLLMFQHTYPRFIEQRGHIPSRERMADLRALASPDSHDGGEVRHLFDKEEERVILRDRRKDTSGTRDGIILFGWGNSVNAGQFHPR
ncbi:hypothetical protein BJ684DRAFT_16223 [Piptocephalis cylindrospora]|uniref:RGS domain-containing protein n=1 Tax=Piptocephalis cylindrospora TaxID=1907219 RepID=A0A4P9Y6B1_9FUNG|nr:hypothetical protein BJ684DRAFT_16223 [Piptocephalis cylindrospora]|eukprot:RKP13370.1 hypothetical protein BJ684DRAFT_16223 [Piptocephalis cylindrospora]